MRLSHGFKRTFFGLSPTFVRISQGDKHRYRGDKYGYLFRNRLRLPCTAQNQALLEELGKNMLEDPAVVDPPDGTIDAGYTYFGQFVDHDITLDVDSRIGFDLLSDKNDQDARELTNYRTPNLELDSVYGDGPAVDSFLYDKDGVKMILGTNTPSNVSVPTNDFDLQRNSGKIAIIGDPRNDENLFVAQLHMSFIRFHNAVVDALKLEDATLTPDKLFEKAQLEVRRHYQWVLVHDFLKTMVGVAQVEKVLTGGLTFFPESRPFFMPVEFSVAAYRFGHSLIRDTYHFNGSFPNDSFLYAFQFTKRDIPTNWIINWKSFFTVGGIRAINKARKIDTRVAFTMNSLPGPGNPPSGSLFATLTSRNLVRSMALRVPTGQTVARQMGETPLTTAQLLQSPFPHPTPAQEALHEQTVKILNADNGLLLKKTPLWYYVLKEAEVLGQGNQLGPVGGGIVTEVFIRLLKDTPNSILADSTWQPRFGLPTGADPINYRIVDLLEFAGTLDIPGTA